MVASLATARVFVPILAQLAEEGEAATGPDGDPLHCATNRRTWPS